LAGVGAEDKLHPQLAFKYGQILSILNNLTTGQQLYATAAGGQRVPASFILQELPQVQDSINTAPVIPEPAAARPQPDNSGAGDPTTRAVGMAR